MRIQVGDGRRQRRAPVMEPKRFVLNVFSLGGRGAAVLRPYSAKLAKLGLGLLLVTALMPTVHAQAFRSNELPPLEDRQAEKNPTAAELSAHETVASALLRQFEGEEYEFRSASEAMPPEKFSYRPKAGDYGSVYPGYGPKELRTFAEQIKHVACANFAFSAELDGKQPPPDCVTGGPNPAKTRQELVAYLRDSFKALKASLGAVTQKNMFDPIEGPYAGPNTRLGLATVAIWHVADHYGQIVLYLRLNGIVPPASRPNPPPLRD